MFALKCISLIIMSFIYPSLPRDCIQSSAVYIAVYLEIDSFFSDVYRVLMYVGSLESTREAPELL